MTLVLISKPDYQKESPLFINTNKIINITPNPVLQVSDELTSKPHQFTMLFDCGEYSKEFTISTLTLVKIAKAMHLPMLELQNLYMKYFENALNEVHDLNTEISNKISNELILNTVEALRYYICECNILSTMGNLSTINKLVESGEKNVLYGLPKVISLIVKSIPQATKLDCWVKIENSETARLLLILLNDYYEGNFTGFNDSNLALKVLIERLDEWVNDKFLRKQEDNNKQ